MLAIAVLRMSSDEKLMRINIQPLRKVSRDDFAR